MKIALVSFYMMEPTIPLAKYLSLSGVDIDLYSLLPYGNQNTYVYDFSDNPQNNGFVEEEIVRTTLGKKLYNYLSGLNTKVFIFPDRWFQKIYFKDIYFAYILANHLKEKKYDLIHIIHTSRRFWPFFYFFIRKNKIIQTLHEVTSHESKTSFFSNLNLNILVKNSIPIIFPSNISKKRFIEFRKTVTKKKIVENNLAMIRFGLFETYYCFSNHSSKWQRSDKVNILNFGRITPSKGIHYLVEAVRLLQGKYPIHLIVAGSGIPDFNFNGIKSYEFINRFISNEEIVKLIEECDMVVLPYSSASQSGVPMTVYAFNKPIIASNIAGFKEVIDNMETGLLVDDVDAQTLASSIELLLKNKHNIREVMSKNIEKKYKTGEFSWQFIAEETISFYREQLETKRR